MQRTTPPGKVSAASNQRGGANGAATSASAANAASSSLDHALLESLFYNEMMLMDESPSLLLSTLAADGTPTTVDPSTLAEKALLQDFGVSSFPPAAATPNANPAARTTTASATTTTNTTTTSTLPTPSSLSTPGSVGVPDPVPPSSAALSSTNLSPTPVAQALRHVLSSTTTTTSHLPHAFAGSAAAATATTPASAVSEEEKQRDKLVSQFTTLASRLGISLPPQLVQTLAAGAAENTLQLTTAATATAAQRSSSSDSASDKQQQPPPPQVQQLQSTAEAAIAAVTRKRSADDPNNNNNSTSKQSSSYNKRRKKPRLSDCERKLAELQTENALLKRHLHTVSDQTAQQNTEQKAVEEKIRLLWKTNAKEEEMDALVKQFSEQYSDYGKRRHHELNFHLEHLERYVKCLFVCGESSLWLRPVLILLLLLSEPFSLRLANPTNFTKMGLWTMGQQGRDPKNNPIAGMLQKELGITPQQGRKILEQRQKIRDLSSNLKEVSSWSLE